MREKVYGNWVLNRERAKWMENTIPYGDNMVLFNGELGEIYVGDGHVHVSDSLYRSHPIMVLREYVLESLVRLSQGGVVTGLECVKNHVVRDGPN